MIIRVAEDRTVRVEDHANFQAFKVVADVPPDSHQTVVGALATVGAVEDEDKVWIPADAVRERVTADAEWEGNFQRMIDSARPYGWIRDEPLRIAAHVEWVGVAR